jgi:hypothetical protein
MSDKPKKSSVRHTRAIQRDQRIGPTVSAPDAVIEARLTELIHPATYAQVATYQAMGLRERVLTLPVMMAFVVSLIWRHVGAVSEAVRVLNQEGFLWTGPTAVSIPAVTQRLSSLPAVLFEKVHQALLPVMREHWAVRTRPIPPAVAWAQQHLSRVLILDGSTLDGLLRKVGLLREREGTPLAGRIAAVLDLVTRLPEQVWFEADEKAHDQRFWGRVIASLVEHTLLIFDGGFLNFELFDQMTTDRRWFLTRPKSNTVYHVQQVLRQSAQVHDSLIALGSAQYQCTHLMRLVEVLWQGKWYRYLTNVLEPQRLPPAVILALYAQRWRIEDAFLAIKRLLGLAYFWVGALNGILVQLWTTWVLYAVLVDFTDEVAQALQLPFQALSLEMVFRALYHFTQAYHRGEATDPVAYLVHHAKLLGIIKRKRQTRAPAELLALTIPKLA